MKIEEIENILKKHNIEKTCEYFGDIKEKVLKSGDLMIPYSICSNENRTDYVIVDLINNYFFISAKEFENYITEYLLINNNIDKKELEEKHNIEHKQTIKEYLYEELIEEENLGLFCAVVFISVFVFLLAIAIKYIIYLEF